MSFSAAFCPVFFLAARSSSSTGLGRLLGLSSCRPILQLVGRPTCSYTPRNRIKMLDSK